MNDVRQLFPSGTADDARGALVLGGCSVLDLAAEFGTPTFPVDETALRAQAQRYVSGLTERGQTPASPGPPSPSPARPSIAAWQRKAAVSTSPVAVSWRSRPGPGVDPATIVLHGNAKTES